MDTQAYYRLNVGKMSLRECWRLSRGNPVTLALVLGRKMAGGVGPQGLLLPSRFDDLRVEAGELSQACHEGMALEWAALQRLGFHSPVYLALRDSIGYLDTGSLRCLHESGEVIGSIIYLKVGTTLGPRQRTTVQAGSYLTSGHVLTVSSRRSFVTPSSNQTLLECPTPGAPALLAMHRRELDKRRDTDPPRTVSDYTTVAALHDKSQRRELADKLARGVLQPMTEAEVEALRRRQRKA